MESNFVHSTITDFMPNVPRECNISLIIFSKILHLQEFAVYVVRLYGFTACFLLVLALTDFTLYVAFTVLIVLPPAVFLVVMSEAANCFLPNAVLRRNLRFELLAVRGWHILYNNYLLDYVLDMDFHFQVHSKWHNLRSCLVICWTFLKLFCCPHMHLILSNSSYFIFAVFMR